MLASYLTLIYFLPAEQVLLTTKRLEKIILLIVNDQVPFLLISVTKGQQSLTHSFTHSLTHSLTHHSVTHSLKLYEIWEGAILKIAILIQFKRLLQTIIENLFKKRIVLLVFTICCLVNSWNWTHLRDGTTSATVTLIKKNSFSLTQEGVSSSG